MASGRIIRLRRPPVLALDDTPFVPPGVDLAEVDRRWKTLCVANPAYFDGRLCHVVGVHRNGYGGATIHALDCAYRLHAVQDERFDLGVRPLGVKGIIVREGRVLLGRRASFVAHSPGHWEFAPGGSVEPGQDPVDVVRAELVEETGMRCVGTPVAVAIVEDDVLRCWEIVYRIDATDDGAPATDEYDELRWCSAGGWPEPLSPIATRMTRLVEAVMNAS